ncbi:PaaI family thioesterase [Aspergillus stella-maris]|uniref:PaaI family thioesterase n=1 Tax=Aspergillus stella-maris TaxID=1810926 RepID=UPI003CCE0EE3
MLSDPSPPQTEVSTLPHVQTVYLTQKSNSPIYALLLADLTLLSATPGTITATLPLEPLHCNSKGTLHGTASACLVDWAAGMAIASQGEGHTYTGVSTDLSVSYLGTAKVGDVLVVEGRALKIGGTLGFFEVLVYKETESERKLIVKGSHTKYLKKPGN